MRCEEALELITAFVDNELHEPERPWLESHLRDCPNCRSIHRGEQTLKREIRMIAANVRAPADLRDRILASTRASVESRRPARGWKSWLWPSRTDLRLAFAGAIIVLVLIPLLYVRWPTKIPIALAALQTHESIVSRVTSVSRLGSPQEVKEFLQRAVAGTFTPMEYDFSVAGLRAVGGLAEKKGDRKILVTVYEGKSPPVSCYTFLAGENDAPAGAKVFFDARKGTNFYTFSQGGINGVMQRVGERVCILVSEMPMQDLIALARSKTNASYGR